MHPYRDVDIQCTKITKFLSKLYFRHLIGFKTVKVRVNSALTKCMNIVSQFSTRKNGESTI